MIKSSRILIAGLALALGATGLSAQTQTPSTTDGAAQQKGQPQSPGSTGAMDKVTTGVATSPDDVKRQTEGRPTAADEAKGAAGTAAKPDVTQQSPGTVGAAPGTTPSMGENKK